jgi:O-antigen/teichoic acid export membrane protein
MSLTEKTAIGIVWNLCEQLGRRGVQVLVTLVLAYFLTPDDFGLLGMLAVFLALGTSLMESGFKQALMLLKSPTQDDYNTAFYANIGLGSLAYGLLYASAPGIAQFYEEPRLTDLIRVVSVAVVIGGFQVVQVAILSRDLNFSAQLKANLPAAVLSGLLAILMAYHGFEVWALIAQVVSSVFFISVFLWLQTDWRPTLSFSLPSLSGMYRYGYKLFLSGAIDTVFRNLYVIVIAKVFSAATAGLYFFADRIKQMLILQLVAAIQNVAFPALAQKQGSRVELKRAYRKLLKVMTFILFPTVLVFAALTNLLFDVFLPGKWQSASLYLQLMLLAGVLIPVHSTNLTILKVQGRSDLFLLLEIVKKTLLAAILFITIQYGVVAVLMGQVVLSFIGYFINSYFSGRLMDYGTWEQFTDFLPNLILASLVAVSVFALQPFIEWPPVLELALLGPSSVVIYLLLARLLQFEALTIIIELASMREKKSH